MKTLADVKAEYDVDPAWGVIRSPGKFEAESWYAPIVHEWSMDGGGELLWENDGSGGEFFEVSDVERDMFELDSDIIGIVLEWSDQGFISVSPVNQATYDRLLTNIANEYCPAHDDNDEPIDSEVCICPCDCPEE